MQKPNNYDNTSPYKRQEPLELGGHILKIIKVEEAKSKAGNPMILIYLDTDKSDKQPFYFKKRYDNDTRQDKKWGCIVYQLVEDTRTGDCNQGLVTFHDAVTKSNSNFKLVWGDKYCDCFKNKLIGGVFGREQYKNSKGNTVFATKCFWLRTVEEIKNGVDVPADKLLPANQQSFNSVVSPDPDDFTETESDDDYPF